MTSTSLNLNWAPFSELVPFPSRPSPLHKRIREREEKERTKEREEKERLFHNVVAELKKTFEKTDLKHLQNLSIGFDETANLNVETDEPQGETIGLAE